MHNNQSLLGRSLAPGALYGTLIGCIIGAVTGALTVTLLGALVGGGIGLVGGGVGGALVGAAVARTAGATGGVSVGAYTGMLLGGLLGALVGVLCTGTAQQVALIRETIVLDALTRPFEAGVLGSFLFAVLGTAVGSLVGGRNLRRAAALRERQAA